ncbi:MAG: isopenicillin N synthase family oxygenase [Proteobacteria bacterium]|nr:isopenicillin N synthase family oxygenase [Pseudomonadota bacterium]MCP4919952.1 isopenicillin N synthase family oxygenase [Pseudomonadota bacterium]
MLPYSPNPGLQIKTRAGEWLDVTTPRDVMICDTGDMMSLLTGVPATTHRVVNPMVRDEARFSMPFFLHPHPNADLGRLTGGPTVKARDFLRERLQAIGVA